MKKFKPFLVCLRDVLKLFPYLPLRLTINLLLIWLISIRFNLNRSIELFKARKNSYILKWLQDRYDYLVPEKFSPNHIKSVDIRSLPIWIFWYQGIENMPEIVRLCYKSICNNADGRVVNVISKDNLKQHIDIPDFIQSKLDNGSMTITHFSDILRVSLLYKYGGHWVDATIYSTLNLSVNDVNPVFDSIKITPKSKGEISNYRWSGFYLFSYPNSEAMKCFKDVMYAYFKDKHKRIIDYLLIDYTFEMLYQKNVEFKAIIDNKPYANEYIYSLISVLNNTYTENFDENWNDTTIYKLNWRFEPKLGNTIYNYLINK